MTTVPLLLSGDKLQVNATARFGEVVVEILGANGKPVPDGVSKPSQSNRVDLEVRWLDELPDAFSGKKPAPLGFTLRNARLVLDPLNFAGRVSLSGRA